MSRTGFFTLFTRNVPLIDARAPVEFAQGAIPTACNLPLLNDSERHQIGVRYKKAGQQAAIALGNNLVRGEVKAARVVYGGNVRGVRNYLVAQGLEHSSVSRE